MIEKYGINVRKKKNSISTISDISALTKKNIDENSDLSSINKFDVK